MKLANLDAQERFDLADDLRREVKSVFDQLRSLKEEVQSLENTLDAYASDIVDLIDEAQDVEEEGLLYELNDVLEDVRAAMDN